VSENTFGTQFFNLDLAVKQFDFISVEVTDQLFLIDLDFCTLRHTKLQTFVIVVIH
jgi:hypothetical protein